MRAIDLAYHLLCNSREMRQRAKAQHKGQSFVLMLISFDLLHADEQACGQCHDTYFMPCQQASAGASLLALIWQLGTLPAPRPT